MKNNVPNLDIEKGIIHKDLLKCIEEYGKNLCYLKSRWNDEKEYEDFNEYIKQLKAIFKKFNFKVEHCHKDFHIVLIHKIGYWCTDIKINVSGVSYGFSKLVKLN
jgi:ABC-type Zn uptake system ZnuABC Zn-binding protein ZnuA|tara:strand:+ start:502 stop:816 length:315 start_codon:yes stop_codon:yes gene_type:complete